jgi:hypothetical protein
MSVHLAEHGSEIHVDGDWYLDVLRRAHRALRPRSYFEVGVQFGDTLKLARCPSVAVDPAFQLSPDVLVMNPQARLFEMSSDAFFAAHDPAQVLGRTIDLAFLDGMHAFDFLLRDFIATERFCRPESIILLHDCLPGDDHMTRPDALRLQPGPTNFPDWWTGDVWKMGPVLRAHRPDLQITYLDAKPTGLVAVTNLDPQSRVLQTRYADLVAEWGPVRLAEFGLARLCGQAAVEASQAWLARLKPFGRAHPVRTAFLQTRARVRRLARRGWRRGA